MRYPKLFLSGASACKNAIRASSACLCHSQERNCGPSEPTPRGRYWCRGCVSSGRRAQRRRGDRRPGRWFALGQLRHGQDSDKHGRADSGGSRGGSDWSDDNVNNDSRGDTSSSSDDRPSSRVGSGRESGTSDERPGSDYSPDPPGQFKPPKVTFGDGRTPGVQDHDPEPRWRGVHPNPPHRHRPQR